MLDLFWGQASQPGLVLQKPFPRGAVQTAVDPVGIVLLQPSLKFFIELFQGCKTAKILTINPALLDGPENPFLLAFTLRLAHTAMNQDNPQTSANQAQLFVLVRTPVIHVKALWHTIFCNRLTPAVLEIDCIIGKEDFGMHGHSTGIVKD